jgi:quinol monooxygenase YgiN
MTVRAVTERTVKPDRRDELLFKELRAHAIHQPGCIAGETLTSVDSSGTHLVVSM